MGQQLPCASNHSVPTSELEIDDVVASSSNTSPHVCIQRADSKVKTKAGRNSLDGRLRYEDAEPSANASLSGYSQTLGSNLDGHTRASEYPADDVKVGSMQDSDGGYTVNFGPESEAVESRKCSFKTTYRLVKDEIGHRRLNPQVPVSGNFCRPNSRYSQSKGIYNTTERLNRESLRTGMSQARVERSSPRAPRQARSQARPRGMFGQRNSRNPTRGDSESGTNMPNGFRNMMSGHQPNVGMFVRFSNSNPFAHNDRFFRGLPGFSFNRGFDNDGFFFFTVNLSPQGRQRPTQATKEQIEKAVSELRGLTSDLEIKKGDTCPICLDQFRTTDDVVEMPCPCKRTFFHRKCAVDTLEKTKKIKCPNCRRWDGHSKGK